MLCCTLLLFVSRITGIAIYLILRATTRVDYQVTIARTERERSRTDTRLYIYISRRCDSRAALPNSRRTIPPCLCPFSIILRRHGAHGGYRRTGDTCDTESGHTRGHVILSPSLSLALSPTSRRSILVYVVVVVVVVAPPVGSSAASATAAPTAAVTRSGIGLSDHPRPNEGWFI